MATDLNAGAVLLFYGDTDDISLAKSLVCEEDSNFTGTRSTNSVVTKCQIFKSLGHQDNKVSGNAVVNIDPGPSEGSWNELFNLYTTGTKQYFWYRDLDDNVFIHGSGYFNSIGNQNKADDISRFTWTLEVDGDVDNVSTPTSFDSSFIFSTTATPAAANGISATSGAVDAEQMFEYDLVTPRTGTPCSMNIKVSTVLQLVIDYPSDYTGDPFRYTDNAGVTHSGVFTNGDVNF